MLTETNAHTNKLKYIVDTKQGEAVRVVNYLEHNFRVPGGLIHREIEQLLGATKC